MQQPVNHGLRGRDIVGRGKLPEQLRFELVVCPARRIGLEVRPDPLPERCQGIEIPQFTCQGVVQVGKDLFLHLVQRDADLTTLAAAARVGVVLRKPYLGLRCRARLELHDALLQLGDRLPLAEDQVVRRSPRPPRRRLPVSSL